MDVDLAEEFELARPAAAPADRSDRAALVASRAGRRTAKQRLLEWCALSSGSAVMPASAAALARASEVRPFALDALER